MLLIEYSSNTKLTICCHGHGLWFSVKCCRGCEQCFSLLLLECFHRVKMLWQVDMVLDKLKEDRKIAAATHNIIAYRCDDDDDDFDDLMSLQVWKLW